MKYTLVLPKAMMLFVLLGVSACIDKRTTEVPLSKQAYTSLEAPGRLVGNSRPLIRYRTLDSNIEIRFPGIYPYENGSMPEPGAEWMALQVKENHSLLIPGIMVLEKGKYDKSMHDPYLDHRAFKISSEVGQSFFFIKGLAQNLYAKVISKPLPPRIFPGQPYAFEMGNETYLLEADAVVPEGGKTRFGEFLTDYTLYLYKIGGYRQAIIYTKEFDGNFFDILWLGDLDGDARPDLLISSSATHMVHEATLCLSSLAQGEHLLGMAAHAQRQLEVSENFVVDKKPSNPVQIVPAENDLTQVPASKKDTEHSL